MIYFYFVLSVISAAAFTADMILRYMEKIKSFDYEKPLFKLKKRTVPIDKFLPQNLTMLIVFVLVMSVTGALYTLLGMDWFLSLLCGISGGSFACFIIRHVIMNTVAYAKGHKLPKGEDAAGLDGYAAEDIEAGGCGKAILFFEDREYEATAANSGRVDLAKFDKITALYESGGFYFAVRSDKVYKEVE